MKKVVLLILLALVCCFIIGCKVDETSQVQNKTSQGQNETALVLDEASMIKSHMDKLKSFASKKKLTREETKNVAEVLVKTGITPDMLKDEIKTDLIKVNTPDIKPGIFKIDTPSEYLQNKDFSDPNYLCYVALDKAKKVNEIGLVLGVDLAVKLFENGKYVHKPEYWFIKKTDYQKLKLSIEKLLRENSDLLKENGKDRKLDKIISFELMNGAIWYMPKGYNYNVLTYCGHVKYTYTEDVFGEEDKIKHGSISYYYYPQIKKYELCLKTGLNSIAGEEKNAGADAKGENDNAVAQKVKTSDNLPGTEKGKIVGTDVNMRAEPNVGSKVLEVFENNEPVTNLDTTINGEWKLVRCAHGLVGYVNSKYYKRIYGTEEDNEKVAKVALGSISIDSSSSYVRGILGEPTKVINGYDHMYEKNSITWSYHNGTFLVYFIDNKVEMVTSKGNNGIKTKQGVAVGDPYTMVLNTYGNPTSSSKRNGQDRCYFGDSRIKIGYMIYVSNGKVVGIEAGRYD